MMETAAPTTTRIVTTGSGKATPVHASPASPDVTPTPPTALAKGDALRRGTTGQPLTSGASRLVRTHLTIVPLQVQTTETRQTTPEKGHQSSCELLVRTGRPAFPSTGRCNRRLRRCPLVAKVVWSMTALLTSFHFAVVHCVHRALIPCSTRQLFHRPRSPLCKGTKPLRNP